MKRNTASLHIPVTDIDQNFICHECVSEEFLKKEIRTQYKPEKCSYCETYRKAVRLECFADRIRAVIEEHFSLTSAEPSPGEYALQKDEDFDYSWERPGESVNFLIQEIAGVSDIIASDTQQQLIKCHFDPKGYYFEEDPFGDEACYEESPPDKYRLQESWDFFCQEVKFRARFFSKAAEEVLNELFGDIESLKTFDGKSVVRVCGPNTESPDIYRARVSQTKNSLEQILKNPTQELAAPPPKHSGHGRMSSAGISVFYGGTDAETCIAEVRPPVGSHVVVGKFQIVRKIRLLDFSLLSKIHIKGSYFDPEFGSRANHAAFFEHLVGEFTKPVMPDNEMFEYLPTQIVADFLAEKFKPRLDGIIFDSSQINNEGKNIVLFHNSCGVEPYKLPKGTTVSIICGWSSSKKQDDTEEQDDSIMVFEDVPKNYKGEPSAPAEFGEQESENQWLNDREITLCFDVNTGVDVRVIEETKYESRGRSISRFRHELP